jgi:protein TonB
MSFIGFSVFCQAQKETVDTVKPANTWFNGDSAHRNFEIDAYFPGGNQAWNRFISRHLKYPSSAVKNNIQGVVIVQFVVDAEGSVTDVKAVSGPLELWLPAENVIS